MFAEVHELGMRDGARSETFTGLAGAGDLVATALAEGSRNRRAGELVGQGVPSDAVPGDRRPDGRGTGGGAAAGRDPARARRRGAGTAGLRTLLEGGTTPNDWVQTFRTPQEQPPLSPCRLS